MVPHRFMGARRTTISYHMGRGPVRGRVLTAERTDAGVRMKIATFNVNGVNGLLIGCLYLPNGNPAPGPKFDYKLRWFDRLIQYARTLLKQDVPVVLAGDYNVIPTELDARKPESWVNDALFFPESRAAYRKL